MKIVENQNLQNQITQLLVYISMINMHQDCKTLAPSKRNELEISDLNNSYLSNNKLLFEKLDDNITWLDAGTISSLYEASNLVKAIEQELDQKLVASKLLHSK